MAFRLTKATSARPEVKQSKALISSPAASSVERSQPRYSRHSSSFTRLMRAQSRRNISVLVTTSILLSRFTPYLYIACRTAGLTKRANLMDTCSAGIHCTRSYLYDHSRLWTHRDCSRFSPRLHKEYKLAGSWFLSLSLKPKTQLSLKNFATACASEQPHFSADAFLIVDVNAFQPDERRDSNWLMLIYVYLYLFLCWVEFYFYSRTNAPVARETRLGIFEISQGLEFRVVLHHRRDSVQFLLLVWQRVYERLQTFPGKKFPLTQVEEKV